MSTDRRLAVPETVEGQVVAYVPPDPEEYIRLATRQAEALSGVVEKQKLYSVISGKKFPKAEAWQTIVALDMACPITEWCVPFKDDDGKTIGYSARVHIVKNVEVIASGEMVCGFDDYPCRGKTGMAQHRAAMSSAQTWAGAKAARMKYAWVVTLAGYESTPAEEIEEHPPQTSERPAQPQRQPRQSQPNTKPTGNCPVHSKGWGNRAGRIGHPLGDGEWCWKDELEVQPVSESNANIPENIPDNDEPETIPETLEELQADLGLLDWKWDDFVEKVLQMSWEEWTAIGATPQLAWERFKKYRAMQEAGE
jgi:hypothetical protein